MYDRETWKKIDHYTIQIEAASLIVRDAEQKGDASAAKIWRKEAAKAADALRTLCAK